MEKVIWGACQYFGLTKSAPLLSPRYRNRWRKIVRAKVIEKSHVPTTFRNSMQGGALLSIGMHLPNISNTTLD